MAANNKSFTATANSGLRPSVSIHERIGINGPGLMRNLTIQIPNPSLADLNVPGHYDQHKSLISFQTSKLKDQLDKLTVEQQQLKASDLNNNNTTLPKPNNKGKSEWKQEEGNNDIIANVGKMMLTTTMPTTPKKQSKFPGSASSTFISQMKSEGNETKAATSRSAMCNNNNNNNNNYANWENNKRQARNYNATPVKYTNKQPNPYHYNANQMPMLSTRPPNSIFAKYAPTTSQPTQEAKFSSPKQPANHNDYDENDSICWICDRTDRFIFCRNCSNHWKGRVRTKCEKHPNTLYLMDVEACTKCGSNDVEELSDDI